VGDDATAIDMAAVNAASCSAPTGAMLYPQLPVTSVVTPCRILDVSSWPTGSSGALSACECTSMKPGATTRPDASVTGPSSPS
jgi:hypothetical protein